MTLITTKWHFFPGPSTETPESQNLDYDFAQQELMLAQMGEDPVQEAITAMEKQHEDEKQGNIDLYNDLLTLTMTLTLTFDLDL